MTNTALKIYTAVIALVCTVAIAWSINQSRAAAAWHVEAGSWQAVARRSVAHERLTNRRYRTLAHRYNQLVVGTQRTQRQLLGNLHVAPTAANSIPSTTVPAPTPVGTTTSAPTTHTS
jgi:hypothetical protein